MMHIQVKEMRAHMHELLNSVMHGKEVLILRRHEPIARLIPYHLESILPSMADFRSTIKIKGTLSQALSSEREETRF
ncbi:MAG: type II toxin-antitoxin system prevent-host-death family antitoxin [Gammaproteobacteria bacterium]|nr:type II toxin-antitoxin system prevent-host-death family antitoxin [Gammaproteobacteria bacterium]